MFMVPKMKQNTFEKLKNTGEVEDLPQDRHLRVDTSVLAPMHKTETEPMRSPPFQFSADSLKIPLIQNI